MITRREDAHRKIPRDNGARMRETYLKMVSDPNSTVVAFRARPKSRPRSRPIPVETKDLMPDPQDK